MKFIVDEMPKSKSKCPYSEWKPYPPIMEETGHYICKINHNDCNLCETECQFLKREESDVINVINDKQGTDKYCKQACSDCNLTLAECRKLLYD